MSPPPFASNGPVPNGPPAPDAPPTDPHAPLDAMADAPAGAVPGVDTAHGADLPEFDETHHLPPAAVGLALSQGARDGFGMDAPPPDVDATPDAAPDGDEPEEDAGPTPEEQDEAKRKAIRAVYGDQCPLAFPAGQTAAESDWVRWASGLWEQHRSAMQPILKNAAFNRLMRAGQQWVSWRGGEWREPPAPRDAARVVHNMIRPALQMRQQLVSEQRPGFRMTPTQQTPSAEKTAEGQQRALEYQYGEQRMSRVIAEAEHYAGTDGVAFLYVYWDDDAGPWQDDAGQSGPSGQPAPPRQKLGDLRTEVLRIEEVRVSANASSTTDPDYFIVRKVMTVSEAVARYGPSVVKDRAPGLADASDTMGTGMQMPGGGLGLATGTARSPTQLLQDQDTLDRFLVFCPPSSVLEDGLALVVVGDVVQSVTPLPWGVAPVIRVTDGSEDPAYFPTPCMDDWVPHQKRINALLSKATENVRVNAHGRYLTRPGAIKQETLVGGVLSMLEVTQGIDLDQAVRPIPPFSISGDVKELLQLETQAFEQKSGWNDQMRGSFEADASGRAILASRESVERIFTPCITAVSEAMEQWARVCCHGMRWGYDLPRSIGATGGNRPDLAIELSSADFDGIGTVSIEPETLMPMPRSLKLYMLDSMLEKGAMTMTEYRQRMPFAYVGSMQTPDARQEARARRVALALRQGQQPPDQRWTDDEGIHQNVLEEEILLQDDTDNPQWPMIVQAAQQRWQQLAQQAGIKSGAIPPPGAPAPAPGSAPGGHAPPHGPPHGPPPHQGHPMPPAQQPLLSTNPSVAAGPVAAMSGAHGDEAAAQAMDSQLGR